MKPDARDVTDAVADVLHASSTTTTVRCAEGRFGREILCRLLDRVGFRLDEVRNTPARGGGCSWLGVESLEERSCHINLLRIAHGADPKLIVDCLKERERA